MRLSEESFDLLKVDRAIERRARASRVAQAVLWGGLLAFGLKRRGAVGLVAMAVSLERLYRMFKPDARKPAGQPQGRQLRSSAKSREWDRVDQGLWETFPASDPPGHM